MTEIKEHLRTKLLTEMNHVVIISLDTTEFSETSVNHVIYSEHFTKEIRKELSFEIFTFEPIENRASFTFKNPTKTTSELKEFITNIIMESI